MHGKQFWGASRKKTHAWPGKRGTHPPDRIHMLSHGLQSLALLSVFQNFQSWQYSDSNGRRPLQKQIVSCCREHAKLSCQWTLGISASFVHLSSHERYGQAFALLLSFPCLTPQDMLFCESLPLPQTPVLLSPSLLFFFPLGAATVCHMLSTFLYETLIWFDKGCSLSSSDNV